MKVTPANQECFNMIAEEILFNKVDWKINLLLLKRNESTFIKKFYSDTIDQTMVLSDFSKLDLRKYPEMYINFLTTNLKYYESKRDQVIDLLLNALDTIKVSSTKN
jgi:hypothetical protein